MNKLVVLLLLPLLVACPKDPTTRAVVDAGSSTSTTTKHHDPNCGMGTTDWCAPPDGDPCGAHADISSCSADARCEGMLYRGESVVACMTNARCFGSNCPTVGCISRCETLDAVHCKTDERCKSLPDGTCARRSSCGPSAPIPLADAGIRGSTPPR